MKNQETVFKIRNDESDRQGCVHHTCFPIYMEEGRIELMKKLGFNSKKFEDSGGSLFVTDLKISFYYPINHGDEISVITTLHDIKESIMRFVYIMYNQNGHLVAKANTSFLYKNILKDKKDGLSLKEYFRHLETQVNEREYASYEFKGM